MTLYRLYVENGNRAGFWVQHRNWHDVCARVQTVAGRPDGKLPGSAPIYDHAQVMLDTFDVRSGRRVELQLPLDYCEDRNYSRIAEPFWRNAVRETAAR